MGETVKQYKLVEDDIRQDFERLVSAALAEGWQFDGQLQRPNSSNVNYTQPMTREVFRDDLGNECVVSK